MDGATHTVEARANRDRVRDAVLAGEGFTTLRFDNAAVRDDLDGVMAGVLAYLQALPTPSLRDHPPPLGGGETTQPAANSLSASMTARFWSSVPTVMRRQSGRP